MAGKVLRLVGNLLMMAVVCLFGFTLLVAFLLANTGPFPRATDQAVNLLAWVLVVAGITEIGFRLFRPPTPPF